MFFHYLINVHLTQLLAKNKPTTRKPVEFCVGSVLATSVQSPFFVEHRLLKSHYFMHHTQNRPPSTMSDTTPSPLFGANAYPGSQIDRNVITEPVVIGLMGLRQELADFEEATAAETNDEMANMGDPLPNETTRVARLPNKAFIPSGHLAFDKGGVYCRSRCRVRQYNKDKPGIPSSVRMFFFLFELLR